MGVLLSVEDGFGDIIIATVKREERDVESLSCSAFVLKDYIVGEIR